MKTFKEFLIEILEIDGVPRKKKFSTTFHDEDHIIHHGGRHISTAPSGHLIYQTSNVGSNRKEYHAVDPKTQKVQVSIDGNERNGVLSKILLQANADNTIKAHDFLHHLVTHHDKTLAWDLHSPGGKAVVQKLSKMKGVSTHGWAHGKPVNVTPEDDEYTHAPHGINDSPETEEARKMILVTHRK